MEQGSNDDHRETTLNQLRQQSFRGVYLTPQDALVSSVPVSGEPASSVRARLDEVYPHRFFPTDADYLVKWPYDGEHYDIVHFQIEPGGWDHEHCDACGSTIGKDAECWFTESESTSILCGPCYDHMLELPEA